MDLSRECHEPQRLVRLALRHAVERAAEHYAGAGAHTSAAEPVPLVLRVRVAPVASVIVIVVPAAPKWSVAIAAIAAVVPTACTRRKSYA